MLVQLVDAGVHRPELDHFRADFDDEARIRRAPGRGKLGGAAGVALCGLLDGLGEAAVLAEEWLGAEGQSMR